jgi:hypothetical protein
MIADENNLIPIPAPSEEENGEQADFVSGECITYLSLYR